MKKILLLFAATGLLTLTGCNNDDDTGLNNDQDTISEVFEVTTSFNAAGQFTSYVPLDPQIFTSDVVLVYRLRSLPNASTDIWEPVPAEYDFDGGDVLKYNFDFDINGVNLYIDSNFDPTQRPTYFANQVFRIVIVPGYFSDTVNVNNYDLVMSALSAGGKTISIEKR